VELYQSGGSSPDAYAYTSLLTAFLLSDCLRNFASGQIPRSTYLPAGFSNLIPPDFTLEMQCNPNDAIDRGTCNYDPIFSALGYDTANWPMSFFAFVNRGHGVSGLTTRPESLFLYWLAAQDAEITSYVQTTSPDCTGAEYDHITEERRSCTAAIRQTPSYLDACLNLAPAARQRLGEWPNPPAPAFCCTGDCDCGGAVAVNELTSSVNVALGTDPLTACLAADRTIDDQVTVDELIEAVNNALGGCPALPPPTPAPAPGSLEVAIAPVSGGPNEEIVFEVMLIKTSGSPLPSRAGGSFRPR
jgi:hypothetical protein